MYRKPDYEPQIGITRKLLTIVFFSRYFNSAQIAFTLFMLTVNDSCNLVLGQTSGSCRLVPARLGCQFQDLVFCVLPSAEQ